ncbi:Putative leucine-rich repeat domain superfamily [Septoria linicola]|uniref:Leucine-rich repeat domain superfamily n=1 Tax=Septoria linicola TaxID=215465 RepID=A0A9Q9AXJ4_9PEZI|nr:putative leucine-rich repeat domain superfamily [Septoria linicola]USW56889.1 Putative leucine-rich repeat domain superfamily [Septoria linicola]
MPTKVLLFITFAFTLPWRVRGTSSVDIERVPPPCPFSDAQLRSITIQSESWEHASRAILALDGCASGLRKTQELSIKIAATQEVHHVPVPRRQRLSLRSARDVHVQEVFDMALATAMIVNRPPHTHPQLSSLLQDQDPDQRSPPRRLPLAPGTQKEVGLQLRTQAPPVLLSTEITQLLSQMHSLERLTFHLPDRKHGIIFTDSIEQWRVKTHNIKHLTLSSGLERLINISPNVESVAGIGHFNHRDAQRLTLACGYAKTLRSFSMDTNWTAAQLDLVLAAMPRLEKLNMSGSLKDDLDDFIPILAQFTRMRSLRLPEIGHAGASTSSTSFRTTSGAALLVRKRRRAEREVSEKVSWAMRAGALGRLWVGHCEVKLGRYGKHKA